MNPFKRMFVLSPELEKQFAAVNEYVFAHKSGKKRAAKPPSCLLETWQKSKQTIAVRKIEDEFTLLVENRFSGCKVDFVGTSGIIAAVVRNQIVCFFPQKERRDAPFKLSEIFLPECLRASHPHFFRPVTASKNDLFDSSPKNRRHNYAGVVT